MVIEKVTISFNLFYVVSELLLLTTIIIQGFQLAGTLILATLIERSGLVELILLLLFKHIELLEQLLLSHQILAAIIVRGCILSVMHCYALATFNHMNPVISDDIRMLLLMLLLKLFLVDSLELRRAHGVNCRHATLN